MRARAIGIASLVGLLLFGYFILTTDEGGTDSHFRLTFPFNEPRSISSGWLYNDGSFHGAVDYRTLREGLPVTGIPIISAADGSIQQIFDEVPNGYDQDASNANPQPLVSKFALKTDWVNQTIAQGTYIICQIQFPKEATSDGEVRANTWLAGNYIKIAHLDGITTSYGHTLQGGSPATLQQGDQVTRGQIIAKSGNTGCSTGPHLHFTVRQNGVRVDPYHIYEGPSYYPNGSNFKDCGSNHLWTVCPPEPPRLVVVTSSLSIAPDSPQYRVGNELSAQFSIKNKGNAPITFVKLTVGGRLDGKNDCTNYNPSNPNNMCPDFDISEDITLIPVSQGGSPYPYQGTFIPRKPGIYEFQAFYCLKDCDSPNGDWHWNVPTDSGVTHSVFINVVASDGDRTSLGDCDRNGRVNIFDLTILMFNWFQSNPTCDPNSDGTVDIVDFSILLSNWTG